ncbi:unnamed protein product [Heligmosomoides polygyrus]|uniref:ETS domain-containing protein n=1 Tax=Heligmosomoides polygyrus TaxID=6339 RepID=A0A183FNX8_HELPZ|nr:unnamed protein product [Heligmosomoides polygyrus]
MLPMFPFNTGGLMPYPMFPFTPFFGLQSLPPLPLNYPFMYPSSMSDRMTPNADKASDEGYMSPTASETSSCSVDASDLHQTPGAQQSTTPTGFFPFSPAQFFPEKSPSLTGHTISDASSEFDPCKPGSASKGPELTKKEVQDFFRQDLYKLTNTIKSRRKSMQKAAAEANSPIRHRRSTLMLQMVVDMLSNHSCRSVINWTGKKPLEFAILDKKRFTAMWNQFGGKEDSFMSVSCIMRALGKEAVKTIDEKRLKLISWTESSTFRFFPDVDIHGPPILRDCYFQRLFAQLLASYHFRTNRSVVEFPPLPIVPNAIYYRKPSSDAVFQELQPYHLIDVVGGSREDCQLSFCSERV